MTVATTITLISTFKEPLLKLFGDLKKEVEFFIDNGLSGYVESIEGKFAHTKTFLYRNETVLFYDVFFPVSLKIGNTIKKVTSYNDLFSNSRYVSILGTAGSGKTMLMKHFFLSCIKDSYKIPIYVELRSLNDYEKSFTEFMYEVLFNNKLSPDQKILERILESGEFIILLDGYDEIYSDKKNKITSDLDKFIDRYSKNNFIISSRPGSGIESFPRFDNYFVQDLSNKEVFSFIDLVLKGNEDKELSHKIKEVINKSFSSDYSNFLKSPLLLSMFILTFNTYPELPKKKSKFYWNVFDTLATKHDSFTKKGGYLHERKTKLQNEDFEKILQWFSFISLFQGKLNFDAQYLTNTLGEIKKSLNYDFTIIDLIEDLTLAISIIIIDGIEYKFPHKSLQEYFCAMLIKEQSNEAKEKIYKNKFAIYVGASTGGFDNFWNLCYELDKTSFLRNFIIFNLVKFKENIYNPDSMKQLKLFFELSRLGDHVIIDENDVVLFTGNISYNTSFSLYIALLSYLNIDNLYTFTLADDQPENRSEPFIDSLKNYIVDNKNILLDDKNEGHYFHVEDFSDQALEEIILKARLNIRLNELIEKIDFKVVELEKEIRIEEQVTDSLLNL